MKIQVALLEVYALILANIQAMGGVRTDEAKYLLNIPDPHPPLFRTLFHWTEWFPGQVMLWRVILATLLVQAVWLVWDRARNLKLSERATCVGAWLFSSGLILQAGSVMLSTVIALEALVLVWLLGRLELVKRYGPLLSLFWLAMLFTSYQGFLFLPLVWTLYRRCGYSVWRAKFFVGIPVLLLILYTLSNPLAAATMLIHQRGGASLAVGARLWGIASLLLLAGSGLISLVGTWGILRSRNLGLIASFVLVAAYVGASVPYPFYAILFTPLIVEGVHALLKRHPKANAFPLLACFAVAGVVTFLLFRPPSTPGPATAVMKEANMRVQTGSVLLVGSFGHDWQYHSHLPVLKYSSSMTSTDAPVIVCISECPRSLVQGRSVTMVDGVEVYVRITTSAAE